VNDPSFQNLHQRLEAIEERNARVEADKAWERSAVHIGIVACTTYIVATVFLLSAKLPHPFLNALVPTIGYILSMQSLPILKKWWIHAVHQKNKV
jgi:hypothetical protein